MTIHVKPPFQVSPSPTTLRRRMNFRVDLWSDGPPELATFEYTSHRQDVYFEERPMVREEEITGTEDEPQAVEHRIYLDSLPGTHPAYAPITLIIRGENGGAYRMKARIDLKTPS